ncbi:hypothetical protein [Mucilaginibacter sp.]
MNFGERIVIDRIAKVRPGNGYDQPRAYSANGKHDKNPEYPLLPTPGITVYPAI